MFTIQKISSLLSSSSSICSVFTRESRNCNNQGGERGNCAVSPGRFGKCISGGSSLDEVDDQKINRLLNQVGTSRRPAVPPLVPSVTDTEGSLSCCVVEGCGARGDTLDQTAAWLRGGVSGLPAERTGCDSEWRTKDHFSSFSVSWQMRQWPQCLLPGPLTKLPSLNPR